jgi:hypothetical protein
VAGETRRAAGLFRARESGSGMTALSVLRGARCFGAAAGRASKGQAAGAAAAPAAAAAAPDLAVKLRELADLHATGALTDAEFAAAKAKLLAS